VNNFDFGSEANKDGAAHGQHGHDDSVSSVTINTDSITIDLTPDFTDKWFDTCRHLPIDQGNHGFKFSSSVSLESDDVVRSRGSVHLTIHKTNRILVQGSSHLLWYEDEFPSLCRAVHATNTPQQQAIGDGTTNNKPEQPQATDDTDHADKSADNSACPECTAGDNDAMLQCDKCTRWWHISAQDFSLMSSNHSLQTEHPCSFAQFAERHRRKLNC
jgi:hypothetical protein